MLVKVSTSNVAAVEQTEKVRAKVKIVFKNIRHSEKTLKKFKEEKKIGWLAPTPRPKTVCRDRISQDDLH